MGAAACLQDHPVNQQRAAQGKAPANLVLLRGCGVRIAVQPFTERWGLRACMVAPTRIIAGLGMSLGIELLDVPGATGAPAVLDTEHRNKDALCAFSVPRAAAAAAAAVCGVCSLRRCCRCWRALSALAAPPYEVLAPPVLLPLAPSPGYHMLQGTTGRAWRPKRRLLQLPWHLAGTTLRSCT